MGFGRRVMDVTAQEVKDYLCYQTGALREFVRAAGSDLQHMKPHGILYNMMERDEALAAAAGEATLESGGKDLILMAMATGAYDRTCRKMGVRVCSEGFADRAYDVECRLVSRKIAGSLITDPRKAAEQAVRMAVERKVRTIDGVDIDISVQSICCHGDTPGAPDDRAGRAGGAREGGLPGEAAAPVAARGLTTAEARGGVAARGAPESPVADAALKRTPLHAAHVKAGARMVPFGGWEMPVQYTGILEEHRATRAAVGIFDVSHMGEFEVEGPEAAGRGPGPDHQRRGRARRRPGPVLRCSCHPDGGIVDDLTVYRLAAERFMITVNAGNIDKDWAWVTEHGRGARWKNVSAETALIAVQGPRAEGLVARLADGDVASIRYYRFAHGRVAGAPALISRTGYTGEDGFELYVGAGDAERLWAALLSEGARDGAVPVGLGARDTLRLEMAYALYGNDIDETTNPAGGRSRLGGEARQGRVHRPQRRGARASRRARPASWSASR